MEEQKTAVVLNDIAGKDSSTQGGERGWTGSEKVHQPVNIWQEQKYEEWYFFLKKKNFWLQKYIYIISNSIIGSKDSSKRYGQEVAVLEKTVKDSKCLKKYNLWKHHITDLKEQEK